MTEANGNVGPIQAREDCSVQHAIKLLEFDKIINGQILLWANFNASSKHTSPALAGFTALLSLLMEKPDGH